MQQPPDRLAPRFSPDGMWWWDGAKWLPASQAPTPAQPAVPPSYYVMPPPATFGWAPSPGLRLFLIVFLVVQAAIFGLFTIAGVASIVSGSTDPNSITFWLVVAVLFVLPVASLIGVFMRTPWARWVALADGVVVSLTCLGLVFGIPILISAARAPLGKPKVS
jgi:hypothetical protein